MYFQTEARQIAENILELRQLRPMHAVLVLLRGDLGAGKTSFVKTLLSVLGADGNLVQSPTFLKLLEYEIPQFGQCLHVDAYRMQETEELGRLSLESYDNPALILVEWPDLFLDYLKLYPSLKKSLGLESYFELHFELKNSERSIRLEQFFNIA